MIFDVLIRSRDRFLGLRFKNLGCVLRVHRVLRVLEEHKIFQSYRKFKDQMDGIEDDFGVCAMCRCPKDTILDRKVLLSKIA